MRPQPEPRGAFPHHVPLQLRWHDNDIYGHVNNARYYDLFDTAVNGHLLAEGALAIGQSAGVFLVVSSGCDYFAEIAFPDQITAGLRVDRLGTTSVTYAIGLFRADASESAAVGRFVHVHVDRNTRRPVPIPESTRRVLQALCPGPGK